MLKINLPEMEHDWLDLWKPIKTLIYYDGPLLYTCSSSIGNNYLVFWCEVDKTDIRYLVTPCSDDKLEKILSNKMDLRTANTDKDCWIFDASSEDVKCWKIEDMTILNQYLPEPGVFLGESDL